MGLAAKKEKTAKNFRRVFQLVVKHKSSNKDIKKKKNSKSGLLSSTQELRNEVHKAGKTIKSLNISEAQKKRALRRLHRLHKSNRPHIGGAAKKEEVKK